MYIHFLPVVCISPRINARFDRFDKVSRYVLWQRWFCTGCRLLFRSSIRFQFSQHSFCSRSPRDRLWSMYKCYQMDRGRVHAPPDNNKKLWSPHQIRTWLESGSCSCGSVQFRNEPCSMTKGSLKVLPQLLIFKKMAGTSCTTHQLLWIRLRSRSMRWPLGLRWKTIVVCPVLKLYISRLKYQIVTHQRSIGSHFSAEQNQLPSWPEIYQMIVEYPQRYINPEELPRS